MISDDKITEIYCKADDFCKIFQEYIRRKGLNPQKQTRKYHRESTMSDAEVMTILIAFHLSGHRCLKHFYLYYVKKHMAHLFPKTVSYNRFVELERVVALPLLLFLMKGLMGKCTGISIIDSTPLRVCLNQRIAIHRVFKGIAQRGHCSMGWFYGFKLHLICNEKGELLNFMLTPGNVDDREPLNNKHFIKEIFGKLVGDKGYISQTLFDKLFVDGIQLVTKFKKNMRGCLMTIGDKLLIRKRALIETINDELKNIAQIEHSRHRSLANFIMNLLSALAAYCFFPKKPMINLERVKEPQNHPCQLEIF